VGETDKEALLALLERFGLEPDKHELYSDNVITLQTGQGKVDGYSSFFCSWKFDEAGQFVGVTIYE
jgi:hypothetical protein